MGWVRGKGVGGWGDRRRFFFWCVVVALCFGQMSSDKHAVKGDVIPSTTTDVSSESGPSSSDLEDESEGKPPENTQVQGNTSAESLELAGNGSGSDDNETEHEGFHVARFDWQWVQVPMIISLTVLIATLAKIVFHLENKLSTLIPESCILIIVGVVIGVILYYAGFVESDFFELEANLFFFYLLPPIILDAGYFMPTRAFFDNIGTIFLYAIIGTLLNTVLLGFSLWGFSSASLGLNTLEVLTFAALLSAVDPVAVLAVFEEAHVNEVLYIIVFGESLLNDGVTVVLYHMFQGFTEIGTENLRPTDIGAGIGSFFVVAGCGTVIGIVFGCLASLLMRVTVHVPVIQPLLVLNMGYLAYVFAEMFHLSGILSCTFCGITMRKYVEANMSRKSHTTTKYFLKLLASVAETIVFMYLGMSTVTNIHHWDWGFCILTLVFCLVFRSIIVLFLTSLVNIRRLPKLGKVDQFIMSYGGLRGAIAFSLVIVLDENLFERKNLFITTTVFVVYFTNFVMGATIKPLVNLLRVPKSDKHKPSLNEQIHTRFVDHLMAGIEDISGHHGHHELREKFEYIDKKYLQPIFVRRDAVMKRGWSIINVYEKLNERDARELLKGNQDYSELYSQLQRDPASLRNMSFIRVLSSIGNGHIANGFSKYHHSSSGSLDIGEQTQIDLHAMEVQDSRKMRDDSKVHHIIEDAMFMPRKRFTSHRRHMLPPECDTHQQQMHHKARLHLRHLVSHHRDSHHCGGSTNGQNGSGKPKKNVSFAEVAQVANTETDGDIGSTKAESGGDASDTDSNSDMGGIVFTAVSSTENLGSLTDIPVEPVAVEMSLPWKRNTGREPLSSSMTHSMPDDHHPLIGEAPSWVNNTEYTSPGSPPVTPQANHQCNVPAPPSQGSAESINHENPFREQTAKSNCSNDIEMNLITLDTPDHKAAVPVNRQCPLEEEDQNHETIAVDVDTRSSSGHSDTNTGTDNKASREAAPAQTESTKDTPDQTSSDESQPCSGLKSSDNSAVWDRESRSRRSQSMESQPVAVLPWRSDTFNSHEADPSDLDSGMLPWRSNGINHQENVPEASPLPWRQNSEESHPATDSLPWRQNGGSSSERETSPHFPLPWRQNSLENDETASLPAPWKHKKEETNGHLPWRNHSEGVILNTSHRIPPRSQSEAEVDPNNGPPLPWRNNSNMEVKLDQCAPRPRAMSTESPEEESHVPPPPWRHNPEVESSVRSPSATDTFYSLKPQLSCHSLKISEAESKHSEQVHVHHMIEIPHGRPIFDLDCDSGESLDLDSEQVDLHERVMLWLMSSEPEPFQEDELDEASFLPSGVNNNYENPVVSVDVPEPVTVSV